jgi:aminopeptidase N
MAVANGTLVDMETIQNRTVFTWDAAQPMATYQVLTAVGSYEVVESESPAGIPLRHYVFADLQPVFNDAAGVTGEALDWMGTMFGEYPFETFGFVTTRLIRASLETQGMVLLNEDMLNEETVIHEIAHMWFGDWVTMASWADMWHNEGFAVYVSLMWQTRANPGSLNIFMQNLEAEVGREASAEPLGDLDPHRLFGFDSYQRGALMIHYLRQEVGDEAFFAALQMYFDRYGGGVATRAEFIGAFEEASGRDLGDFFFRWLETLNYP